MSILYPIKKRRNGFNNYTIVFLIISPSGFWNSNKIKDCFCHNVYLCGAGKLNQKNSSVCAAAKWVQMSQYHHHSVNNWNALTFHWPVRNNRYKGNNPDLLFYLLLLHFSDKCKYRNKVAVTAQQASDSATEAARVGALMLANTDYPAFTEAADFLSGCPQDFCQRALVSPRNNKQSHTEKKAAWSQPLNGGDGGRNVTCVLSHRRRWSQ